MRCGGPNGKIKPYGKRELENQKIWDFWDFLKFHRAIQIVNIGSGSEEKTNRCFSVRNLSKIHIDDKKQYLLQSNQSIDILTEIRTSNLFSKACRPAHNLF